MAKKHVYDYDYDALDALISEFAGSHYTPEIWQYLYRQHVLDFHEMISLSPELGCQLADRLSLKQLEPANQVLSPDGNTRKDLVVLDDAQCIEVVLLRYRERFSACVSTQVGCACGCVFCATGQMGFVRQLSAGEILAQVIYLQRALKQQGQTLSNVVLMGMGEPLLNYDATMTAVRRLTDSRGMAIAPKRITLSTVGVAPAIRKLAGEPIPIKLAVSLHAATDVLRDTLMPINRSYPLASLWDALQYYTSKTGRRVLLEWIMIKGVNDTTQAAHDLVSWVRELPVHVNLIQLNVTDTFSGEPSTGDTVDAFTAVLDRYQILHTMRQRRGGSIRAGCGQLRSRHMGEMTENSIEIAIT